jgi:putative ABC transport system ATP-binding protein
MVTHSMAQAVHLGERIVMMHKGRMLHDITGDERQSITPEGLLERFEAAARRDSLDTSSHTAIEEN